MLRSLAELKKKVQHNIVKAANARATGSPPSALASGAPELPPSAPSREMGRSATCACGYACGSPAERRSVTKHEGVRSPQLITLNSYAPCFFVTEKVYE